MYIPKQFEVADLAEVKRFVTEVAAADFVTVDETGQPIATLMPTIWVPGTGDSYGKLLMHMSRGNKQWKSITNGQRALAIVHGPQAYISPVSYAAKAETGKVVPTWNYTAVNFTGTVDITEDENELLTMVSQLTDFHEVNEAKPWKVTDAPSDYITTQLRGIIGVTFHIETVEAKAKLNQNRSAEDRAGVIATLSTSEKPEDRIISGLMTTDDDVPNRLS